MSPERYGVSDRTAAVVSAPTWPAMQRQGVEAGLGMGVQTDGDGRSLDARGGGERERSRSERCRVDAEEQMMHDRISHGDHFEDVGSVDVRL